MAVYAPGMTSTANVDASVIELWETDFFIATGQNDVATQFAQYRAEIGAKSIQLTKFNRMAPAVTPLLQNEPGVSKPMQDNPILIVPKERGDSITRTALASLQTGGKVDRAGLDLVSQSYNTTMNVVACQALDQATQIRVVDGKAASAVTAADVLDRAELNYIYNRLARKNVGKFGGSSGNYIIMLHDDVVTDIRDSVAGGSWTNVLQYTNAEEVFNNEIGLYQGFRFVVNNDATIVADGGDANVDLYNSYAFGDNAFGKVVSHERELLFTPSYDPQQRFLTVAWYEVSDYAIIDNDSIVLSKSASSVGANA